jgi:hypothetical protein
LALVSVAEGVGAAEAGTDAAAGAVTVTVAVGLTVTVTVAADTGVTPLAQPAVTKTNAAPAKPLAVLPIGAT